MPANETPETATEISSLPYSISQDPTGSPDSSYTPLCGNGNLWTPLWFKYTPPVGVTAIGFGFEPANGLLDYFPLLSIWTGTPPSLTQVPSFCFRWTDSYNAEVVGQINVEPGTTYYFQFLNDFNSPGTLSNLEFRLEPAPADPVSTGSFLISNDTNNFPTAIISAVDGTIEQIFGFPAFEQAARLADGTLLVAAIDDDFYTASFKLYDNAYTLLATITSPVIATQYEFNGVATDGTDFYVVCGVFAIGGGNGATLHRISAAGVVGTNWTLPAPAGSSAALAVGGGIAYWGVESSSNGAIPNVIYRYDIVGDAPLSNLVTAEAGFKFGRDFQLTADGDLLVIGRTSGNDVVVRLYSTADGSLIRSFDTTTWVSTVGTPRFRIDPDAPDEFVVMTASAITSSSGTFTFERFRISDGTLLDSWTTPFRRDNNPPWTPMFGASQSCPLIILGAAAPPSSGVRLTQLPVEVVYPFSVIRPYVEEPGLAWNTPRRS